MWITCWREIAIIWSFWCDQRTPHSKDSVLATYAELPQSDHQRLYVAYGILHFQYQCAICGIPGRNRTLFRCVFRSHCCVWRERRGSHALGKLINICHVYTARMSPALNGSSALPNTQRNNVRFLPRTATYVEIGWSPSISALWRFMQILCKLCEIL